MKNYVKQFLSLGLVLTLLATPVSVQATTTDDAASDDAQITTTEITDTTTDATADGDAATASDATTDGDAATGSDTTTDGDAATGSDTTTGADAAAVTDTEDAADDNVVIEEDDKPYLALGADLDADQLATVLGLLGVDAAQLDQYDVSYINNSEEHQYLDSYIDSSKIGTKSWSSVVIVQRDDGNGINISTKNINYCTVGMYKNALVTAGIKDADIIVAGPKPISGTAALVGIFKAYAQMTGDEITEESVDTALNELVLTGQFESATGADAEAVEGLVAYLKQKVAEGALKDEESMNQAIEDACDQFDVTLTDEQKADLISLLKKIDELNLDPDTLIDQAKSIYDKLSGLNLDDASGIGAAIGSFFSGIIEAIKNFFANLFK